MTTIKTLLIWSITLTVLSCGNNKPETVQPEIKQVNKEIVNPSISATGIIKPKVGAEVKVGSRVSGVVKKLFVKNGDVVQKGDLLARLDDAELSARCRLEMANLTNAETIMKYAKADMERIKALANKEFTSVQTFDNAIKEYEIANARVESQKAALDYANTQLSFTKVFAPISGVIGSVSTQEGETVTAAFAAPTFVTIIDLSRIEVWAYVDETDIGKVAVGQNAQFTVDTYPGEIFNGKITAIYPKAEIKDNVVNYIAIVEIEDDKGKILRPEMTTSVTIEITPLERKREI
jgi:RND family efflux transporter MFP subunit